MANFNINKVILGGRITKDIELKQAGETNVANFSLAINRRKQGETDFVNCTAFGKLADMAAQYFHKGSCMCVVGHIAVDAYEKDGEKRTSTKVIADEIHFVDSKAEAPASDVAPKQKEAPAKTTPAAQESSGSDDDDLPF